MVVMDRSKMEVLRGTLNVENPLVMLRGNAAVWTLIFEAVDEWYEQHVDRDSVAYKASPSVHGDDSDICFPEPTGLNINMMPIVTYHLDSLPENCRQYWPIIQKCYGLSFSRNDTAYLTVHESLVPVGETHRRPGLHIESPGAVVDGGRFMLAEDLEGQDYQNFFWGGGNEEDDILYDGIFMASNVADSSRVWPVLIDNPAEVTDRHGGIEPMRKLLGEGVDLAANQLCWITDRTPHESLPLKAPESDPDAKFVYRQFFRLVMGRISVWYSQHNTPNPEGVEPEPELGISDADKFSEVWAGEGADVAHAQS